MTAKIWNDINDLATHLREIRTNGISIIFSEEGRTIYSGPKRVVCTSGGYDPLHVGHLQNLLESRKLGERLVVIVNSDGFLLRKKGYVFMPLEERLQIVAAIAGVDHVIAWDDGSQFVDKALEILKPDIFTKGGDRSRPQDIAPCELEICEKIGCKLVLGVGGDTKAQSSSSLALKAFQKNNTEQNE